MALPATRPSLSGKAMEPNHIPAMAPGAAPVPAPCRRRRRRVVGAGFPLFAALLAALPGMLAAQPKFTLETTHQAPHQVAALAISADETLIAAAAPADGERVVITLLDRPSGAPAGRVDADVGAAPRLRFAPSQNLLLVAGSTAVQLWEVAPRLLVPGKTLGPDALRWAVPLPEGKPAGGLAFAPAPQRAIWKAGGAVFQREVTAGSPAPEQPAWQAGEDAGTPGGLTQSASRLAVFGGPDRNITLLGTATLEPQETLRGHRFPVAAAPFDAAEALTSLDGEGNLFAWGAGGQGRLLARLDPEKGAPRGLLPLAPPFLLLTAEKAGQTVGLLLNRADGSLAPGLTLPPGTPVAASPTGRYLLAATGRGIRLYGFSRPLAPAAYAEQLKQRGAPALARHYANLLDTRGVAPKALAALREVLQGGAASLGVEDLLVSLEAARREQDLEGMVYWAQKVLALEPLHPAAVAALKRARDLRDGRLLEQARNAQERGEYRQVISLLASRIEPESVAYPDAQALIQLAERARNVRTTLEQAREQMERANFPAARTLTREALRQDPDNPAAMALQQEVDERANTIPLEWAALWAALALGFVAVGGGLYRFRYALIPLLRKMSIAEPGPGPTRRAARPGTGQAAGEKGAPGAQAPPPGRAAPRPPPVDPRQRVEVEQLMEQIEDLIRLSRQADRTQKFTAFLMELEAELSAIQRRTADAGTDWGHIHARLKDMRGQMRRLKFEPPPEEPGPLAPGHTLYDVLRLPGDAAPAEIKAAYHNLLKEYHPDLHNGSNFGWIKAQAETMSKKISEAYEVLSHPEQRRAYDRKLAGRIRGSK